MPKENLQGETSGVFALTISEIHPKALRFITTISRKWIFFKPGITKKYRKISYHSKRLEISAVL